MNTGIIASRYARALYKYVSEVGNVRQAAAQVRRLQEVLATTPALQQVLDDPAGVSPAQKMALFASALAPEKLLPELDRFLSMLLEKRRMDLVTFIFHDFLSLCDQGEGLVRVRLVTAAPSGTLETRLQKLLQEKTGLKPVIVTEVDPTLLGGFRLELEDRLLDASVRHQLETIRTGLLERNRRIV